MRRALTLAMALVMTAPLISGHAFNHQGRDEVCDIDSSPHGHHVGDGHAHEHGPAAIGMHDHDPCKQIGMQVPAFPDMGPIHEIALRDAVIAEPEEGSVPVITGAMAFMVPGDVRAQSNLVVHGDDGLAAQPFSGTGTAEDPYIIEGYLIRNLMMFANTDACIVVRNNVIWSDALEGPLASPEDVIDRLPALLALEARLEEARDRLAGLLVIEAAWQDRLDELDRELQQWKSREAALQAEDASLRAREDQAAAREAAHQDSIDRATERVEALRVDDADHHRQHEALVVDKAQLDLGEPSLVTTRDAWSGALAQHAVDLQDLADAFAAFEAQAPPEPASTTPAGTVAFADALAVHIEENPADDAARLEDYERFTEQMSALSGEVDQASRSLAAAVAALDEHHVKQIAAADAVSSSDARGAVIQQDLLAAIAELTDLRAQDPPQDEGLREERADFDQRWAAFVDGFLVFRTERGQAVAEYRAAHQDLVAAQESVDALAPEYAALSLSVARFPIEYLGDLFGSIDELVAHLIALAQAEVEGAGAGRLILDWNGQCVHAYHNVIEDLRVNRNNDRTGYATGGVIEDNRIDNVGQIRHYDGIFRHNEVGDRGHLEALLDPTAPPLASERAINNDGANQGAMIGNTIYGRVDLDFHGHHHGAGFYAPESHYHGSTEKVAYMLKSDGTCAYESHHRPPTLEERIGVDNVISDPEYGCLPHHNHHLRWTSVHFQDNVVIDPLGMGLRFEDRNHRGDDADANSENMHELNMPHMHRSFVDLGGNSILGSLVVDVFNADGVDLWDDDYSEVQLDQFGRIIGQAQHLGAEVVNSHRERNDGWLDIQGNAVMLYGAGRPSAIQIVDAKEINQARIMGNQGHTLPVGFDSGLSAEAFLGWLATAPQRDPQATAQQIAAWGGVPTPANAIHLVRVKDAAFEVCANSFDGFTVGLKAHQQIRDDVLIRTCSDNHFGDADPQVDFRTYTEVPDERASQPLRDITDPTIFEDMVDPVYDVVDGL